MPDRDLAIMLVFVSRAPRPPNPSRSRIMPLVYLYTLVHAVAPAARLGLNKC